LLIYLLFLLHMLGANNNWFVSRSPRGRSNDAYFASLFASKTQFRPGPDDGQSTWHLHRV